MAEFLDFDPVRGVTTSTDWDEGRGDLIIHQSQDVTAALDVAAETRNTGSADKAGKKGDFYLYATIPAMVEVELRNKGIDIYRTDHDPAFYREIEANYPDLKMTQKRGWIRH